MAAETIDEITVNYEQDGVQLVKEVEKHVLTRGAWTTIMFLYQDLDRNTKDFGPEKVTIRRYKKIRGEYRQQNKFNISNREQARKIRDVLEQWFQFGQEATES
ncbi:MAG: hypothetical protein KC609_14890 [Myxococcales bacterium]|nr:hypothetical protein [Myxococcales bacterium]